MQPVPSLSWLVLPLMLKILDSHRLCCVSVDLVIYTLGLLPLKYFPAYSPVCL